jgi:hypothetical protein
MKFVVLLNIVIPYDGNKFVYHLKHLIIIISQMNFFQGNNHKYAINFLVKNNFEMSHLLKFHFKKKQLIKNNTNVI